MKIRKRFVRWFGNAKAQNAAGFKEKQMAIYFNIADGFLGVYIFTGVGGEWAGIENFRTKYYSETNLADGWIYGEGFSNDDLKAVQSIDGVTQAEKDAICKLRVRMTPHRRYIFTV